MQVHVRIGDDHKSIVGLAMLVVGILCFWWFFVHERPITNYPSTNDNTAIVAFGDSLIQGVGSKKGGGFVSMLEKRLNTNIVNLGVSGDTTHDAWLRVRDVTDLDPKVVIISLGGNDFIKRKGTKAEVEQRLGRIVSEVHRSGASVILLGVPGYYNLHKDVSTTHSTAYIPNILSGLLGKEDFMFDAVHPNDAGYQKITADVLPVLFKLMN